MEEERLFRLYGTSIVYDVCRILHQLSSPFATACTIFHHYFHQVVVEDIWGTTMGCVLLACKIEEVALSLRSMITAFVHVYRRRLMLMTDDEVKICRIMKNPNAAKFYEHSKLTSKSLTEKQAILRDNTPPLSPFGALYQAWHKAAVTAENHILRQLGFMLFWIPQHHPHRFLLYFVRVLDFNDSKLMQTAWNYANDCSRLDMCLLYEPQVMACAAVHLACLREGVSMPSQEWWTTFCGTNCADAIAQVCNDLLGLEDHFKQDEMGYVAMYGLVKSKTPGGSFNDPDSFVWDYLANQHKTTTTITEEGD